MPRDDPHLAGVIRQIDRGDPVVGDALVVRYGHLFPGGQVDPQLHHLERAAARGVVGRVELFVDDAAGRGHPLHVALADHAAGAGGVAVFDLAGIDDRDGLEAAVRMAADPAPFAGGRKLHRRGVVEQQEGAASRHARAVVVEHPVHGKSIAHPVPTRRLAGGKHGLAGGGEAGVHGGASLGANADCAAMTTILRLVF